MEYYLVSCCLLFQVLKCCFVFYNKCVAVKDNPIHLLSHVCHFPNVTSYISLSQFFLI